MKQAAAQLEIVRMGEWDKLPLPGRSLCADDKQLVSALSDEAKSKFAIDELKDGLRISSRSWVGVVRFNEFELQIAPKLANENLGLVELIDFAHGIDALEKNSAVRTIKGAGASLFDLVALLLAEACENIARAGILSDYCEVEDSLPVLRGRLLVVKQVVKRFTKVDRVECRYDEYLSDIPENQILLAALSVCASRVQHPSVSMRVRRVLAIFFEACSLKSIDLRLVRSTLVYNRMNEHYRGGHELAWLVLSGLGIDDLFAAGSHQCFAFLLDMNLLFQNFVNRWLGQALRGTHFRVIPQRRDLTILWNADLDRPYTSVIPDILIERQTSAGKFLPVDAKYKRYDEKKMSSSDIYQTFVYAYAFGQQHAVLPTSLVLFPSSVPEASQTRLHVRHSGGKTTSAQVRAVPIHIPSALAEARRRTVGPVTENLLRLIGEVFD